MPSLSLYANFNEILMKEIFSVKNIHIGSNSRNSKSHRIFVVKNIFCIQESYRIFFLSIVIKLFSIRRCLNSQKGFKKNKKNNCI